jgi:hypothetical protein
MSSSPIGEGGSIGVAVVTAGTVGIMQFEVLGDLAGVHAAPADNVLVSECLSEDNIGMDGGVPCSRDLVGRGTTCDTLNNGCGHRSRSFGLDQMVL